MRKATTVVLYAGGRVLRSAALKGARIDEIVEMQLSSVDEGAEAVVLDEHGHRLERWCRRGSEVVRDWGLPGAVAKASSIPPAPGA